MDRYLLAFLCSSGYDLNTQIKCQEIVKQTVREFHLYKSIKEKEQKYKGLAEEKLTKPGFWLLSSAISSASTQRLYLTGHNFMGIDSVNLKLGKDSEISLSWSF